jgi:hypothetical protein
MDSFMMGLFALHIGGTIFVFGDGRYASTDAGSDRLGTAVST